VSVRRILLRNLGLFASAWALLVVPTTVGLNPVAAMSSVVSIPGACPPIQPPHMAGNAQGDQVAVWACSSSSWMYEVNVSYLPAAGSWTAPTVVGLTTSPGGVQVVLDGNGNGTAVWSAPDHIMAAGITATGTSPAVMLSDPGASAQYPSIATNAAGELAVTWFQWVDGGSAPAVATRATGGDFGPPQILAPSEGRLQYTVPVVVAPSGDVTVGWTFGGPLYISTMPSGGSFGSPIDAPGSVPAAEPRLTVGSAGSVQLAWINIQGAWHVQATTCTTWGTCSVPATISGGSSQIIGLSMDADASGAAVASWGLAGQVSTGQSTFLVQAAMTSGGAWQAATTLGDMGVLGRETHASLDGTGAAFITWTSTSSDGTSADYGVQMSQLAAAAFATSRGTAIRAVTAAPGYTFIYGRLNVSGTGVDTSATAAGAVAGVWASAAGQVQGSRNVERLQPDIISSASFTAAPRTAFSFVVRTVGFPGPLIAASGLPSWITLTNGGDGTARLAGTTPARMGTSVFTISASNGMGVSATQAASFTVSRAKR